MARARLVFLGVILLSAFLLLNLSKRTKDYSRRSKNVTETVIRLRSEGGSKGEEATAPMDTYAEWTVKPVSPCPESTSAFLLILVGSPVTNHYRRHLVRSTWGNITSHKGYSIKVIFYMGKALNYNKQRELLSESKTHNDIVQSEIDDGYYNLTLKNLNGFKWAMKECPVARFVLKVDDDVFVYPKNTVDHLDTLKVSDEVKLYQGYRMSANPAYRNKGNKWYISHEAYKNATYPPYNLGFAVLFSMKVVKEIHDASFKAPGYFQVKRNFPFEDVFIGMCAKYLGIVPEAVYDRFFRNPPSFSDAVSANQCKYLTAIAAHALNPDWFCYYSKASEIVRESNLCAKQT